MLRGLEDKSYEEMTPYVQPGRDTMELFKYLKAVVVGHFSP